MTNKKKSLNLLRYISIHTATITPGANLGYVEPGVDLSSLLETLAEQDGQKAHIVAINDFIQSKSVTSHALSPVTVQTAGNFAATGNLADRVIQDLLNQAIDDEFGFQASNLIISKLAPSSQAAGTDVYASNRLFKISNLVLNILNKEVSTERLQSIWTGVVGTSTVNQPIYFIEYIEVIYYLTAKNIVMR